MYFNVNLEAVWYLCPEKRFSGGLGYNLSKEQEDIRSGKG